MRQKRNRFEGTPQQQRKKKKGGEHARGALQNRASICGEEAKLPSSLPSLLHAQTHAPHTFLSRSRKKLKNREKRLKREKEKRKEKERERSQGNNGGDTRVHAHNRKKPNANKKKKKTDENSNNSGLKAIERPAILAEGRMVGRWSGRVRRKALRAGCRIGVAAALLLGLAWVARRSVRRKGLGGRVRTRGK